MSDAVVSCPVVVSPHLDDAVLSASVQLMRPGARLVTVCTGIPPDGTALGDWDRLTGAHDAAQRVRDRVAEDDAALVVLGVEHVVRLGFPDGQHLPEGGRRADLDAMVTSLRPHLRDATEVWVPAAIGGHPDHVATRDAALTATSEAAPAATVHHFADVPYSLRYGWPPWVTGSEALSAYLDVEQWLAAELSEAGLDETVLTRAVHTLGDDAERRKVKAMACYRTQIPALDYAGALAQGDPALVGFEVSWSRR